MARQLELVAQMVVWLLASHIAPAAVSRSRQKSSIVPVMQLSPLSQRVPLARQ